MKLRFICVLLSMIMVGYAIQPVFSAKENDLEELFSDAPRDMTPVEQDYSPGLGDRMDAVSYTITFGSIGSSSGLALRQTYDDALEIQRMVTNITNGAHQVAYALGQDVLRWGSAPYLIEDTAYPMGDGTPGSGYAKYRKYVEDSFKYNVDVAQILEPLLAGRWRDDYASEEEKIPLSCYTHDENGQKKVGWTAGEEYWYLLSLYNLYESGYAQEAWQRMQDTWNLRTHIYYDALIPVPEGLYNNPNLTTKYGGVITNTEMEWDAVQREIEYSWENYAISSGQEYIHPKYKGLSCNFTVPYGVVTDNDYLNTWGNSVMIANRGDRIKNLVWGSELGEGDYALVSDPNDKQWSSFVTRLMEYNLQYLYMMERKPITYTNNFNVHQVVFSGDLISTYDKKTDNYTLIENGDFVIADGGDRFVPQAGAGCKIYAYSRDGKTRTWRLPDTWTGVGEVDVYKLSIGSAPVKLKSLPVTDGSITMTMSKGAPYLVVPKGDAPTPKTANFNDMSAGKALESYQGLSFTGSDGNGLTIYGASARGGFGSPSIHLDCADVKAFAQIGMEKGAILHSVKIGNRGGVGRVVLHSSNPLNPDVMIELPKTDQVYKFNTSWIYGEIGDVTVKIENDEGVSNVLFDAITYSSYSKATGCANGDHEFYHRHADPICGTDGRDSDLCKSCGKEENVIVLPAIEGEHAFSDKEALLSATAHNAGTSASFCFKCGFKVEETIPKTSNSVNLAFHHDFGFNYMQVDDIHPYTNSDGTVAFDVVPLDVTERTSPGGPCYIGVWFGDGYSLCAAYDFSSQRFVIGTNDMRFGSPISAPLASKAYSWTQMSNKRYPLHRFAFKLIGNTAKIYLDGVEMLSYTDKSFASTEDILLIYTKGEMILDNIIASDSGFDVSTGTGEAILRADFEEGTKSLSDWTLGGYITTDVREFNTSEYFAESHSHTNVLIASHEANYFHGSFDEYECSLCHKRTVVETGDVLADSKLVHMSYTEPTCTESGHSEYWYDRQGNRFSDASGTTPVSLSSVTTAALGHDLTHYPAVEASETEEGFIEYWRCSRCRRSYADKEGALGISLVKTDATRQVENAVAAIGKVKYREKSSIVGSGIVGTFTTGDGNTNYSVLDVGNPGQKLNADYKVEMTIRIRDVDKTTQIGGASGAFFGLYCENFTVGYDFASERWGVSPIGGLWSVYPFQPSETGPSFILDDGYFHTVTFECNTDAIRVYVDGSCVLNSSSLAREDNRYCIFYPRLCTVEFASYGLEYKGAWVNDHLTGRRIVTASTWKDRGSGYATNVSTFNGSTMLDSLWAIENAERMYDALSENEKLLVSNFAALVSARSTYERLESRPLYGDANGNGKINVSDVMLILKLIAEWDVEINTDLADVNCDGVITLTDAAMILKYIAKWDIVLGK